MCQLAYGEAVAELQRVVDPGKGAPLGDWNLACQKIGTQAYTAIVFAEALAQP